MGPPQGSCDVIVIIIAAAAAGGGESVTISFYQAFSLPGTGLITLICYFIEFSEAH